MIKTFRSGMNILDLDLLSRLFWRRKMIPKTTSHQHGRRILLILIMCPTLKTNVYRQLLQLKATKDTNICRSGKRERYALFAMTTI
jgi:hypothetical protein